MLVWTRWMDSDGRLDAGAAGCGSSARGLRAEAWLPVQDSLSVDGRSLPSGLSSRRVSNAVSRHVMTILRAQAFAWRNQGDHATWQVCVALNVLLAGQPPSTIGSR